MHLKRNRRLTIIGEQEIKLQNRNINYKLKQSPRIKDIRLEIRNESGLTVVVPRNYNQQQVQDILIRKARWILHNLPSIKPIQMPLFRKGIDHGDNLPFMDERLTVIINRDNRKPASANLEGNKLTVSNNGAGHDTARILEKWYRQQAALIFKQKADFFKNKMGLRYKRIYIRGQRTRWGSCSPLGNLTLNWKLLMAPETIIDYVIIHELAHLKHMNHSDKFWELVNSYCPRWKEYRKWLILHEDDLKSSAAFGLS